MLLYETRASYESAIRVVKRELFVCAANEQNMAPFYLFQRQTCARLAYKRTIRLDT